MQAGKGGEGGGKRKTGREWQGGKKGGERGESKH